MPFSFGRNSPKKSDVFTDDIFKELKSVREDIEGSTYDVDVYNQIYEPFEDEKRQLSLDLKSIEEERLELFLEARTKLLRRASEIILKAEKRIKFLQEENLRIKNFIKDLDNSGALPKRFKILSVLKEIL